MLQNLRYWRKNRLELLKPKIIIENSARQEENQKFEPKDDYDIVK